MDGDGHRDVAAYTRRGRYAMAILHLDTSGYMRARTPIHVKAETAFPVQAIGDRDADGLTDVYIDDGRHTYVLHGDRKHDPVDGKRPDPRLMPIVLAGADD
jgi:hypothetical protein